MKLNSYSTIVTLSSGAWDGFVKYKDIKKTGNFGIGTFDQGNGEMIAIDNEYYQLLSDGSVNYVEDEWLSPFAMNCFFQNKYNLNLKNLSFNDFENEMNKFISENGNQYLYALKIKGVWKKITTRTVNKLSKPYPTIGKINENQKVYTFNEQEGSMVAFYTPGYLKTIGVDGFHIHYINDKKTLGGHVLDFYAESLEIEIAIIDEIDLKISNFEFDNHDDIQEQISIGEGSKNRK